MWNGAIATDILRDFCAFFCVVLGIRGGFLNEWLSVQVENGDANVINSPFFYFDRPFGDQFDYNLIHPNNIAMCACK